MIMKKILIFLFAGLLSACAVNDFAPRNITTITSQDSLSTTQKWDKLCYSAPERTFYCLNTQENTVNIYKNGQLFNVIGGSGFSEGSFLNLSDICLGIDNMLYTLDSFSKVIKRFDSTGRLLSQVNLDFLNNPSRFITSSFGEFFVYDSHEKTIIVIDNFTFNEKFSFGKFQINNLSAMFIFGDYLHVYDEKENKTSVFMTNGLYVDEYDGLVLYSRLMGEDAFATTNRLIIHPNTIEFQKPDSKQSIYFERDYLLLCTEDKVVVYRL